MQGKRLIGLTALLLGLSAAPLGATVFGTLRGVVHDPSHRPVAGANVTVRAVESSFAREASTGADGDFTFTALSAGDYVLNVSCEGFAQLEHAVAVSSGQAPVVHLQLALREQRRSIEVSDTSVGVSPQSATPVTTVGRAQIAATPGAALTNSFALITSYVPGAYMTHDQLHIRGGHQVTWLVDGVQIPNTNIASNVGPQIDPKDIDYLEVQRGGYSAEYGDRTYAVFNVVPRTGFERDNEIEFYSTYGSFHQTNDQLNAGGHTTRLAWFASLNGNRTDYGLATPGPLVAHDRGWGLGGFASLIYNRDAANQFRLVVSARGDDYQIPNDQDALDAGVRDVERERDVVADFTWAHTFSKSLLLTVSPFLHVNQAHYDGDPNTAPVATVQHLDSTYAGAQFALSAVTAQHNAKAGLYGFGQHDDDFVHLTANDGSGAAVRQSAAATGHLEAGFLEDQWRLRSWLTMTAGVRLTHFSGAVSENAADPRFGLALRIPRLNWVLRGFYGRYYQAPPLSTVSGPLLDYAVTQGLGFIPLKGERDEENQVGLSIPFRGWTADVNSFRMRARNYFDHNAIGNSNVFFPLSIAGARIRGTEFTLRSPRLVRRAEAAIAYSYQRAEGQGAVTGGLTDFSPPASGYFLLDHDQRHTLHGNVTALLPWSTTLSAGVAYGSGFTDGSSETPAHLQLHTTFDVSIGRSFGERLSLSITALNAANRRFLLDNSETFGGTHYADPRQIYAQLRFRFHF